MISNQNSLYFCTAYPKCPIYFYQQTRQASHCKVCPLAKKCTKERKRLEKTKKGRTSIRRKRWETQLEERPLHHTKKIKLSGKVLLTDFPEETQTNVLKQLNPHIRTAIWEEIFIERKRYMKLKKLDRLIVNLLNAGDALKPPLKIDGRPLCFKPDNKTVNAAIKIGVHILSTEFPEVALLAKRDNPIIREMVLEKKIINLC